MTKSLGIGRGGKRPGAGRPVTARGAARREWLALLFETCPTRRSLAGREPLEPGRRAELEARMAELAKFIWPHSASGGA
jgi:hypothetical protein